MTRHTPPSPSGSLLALDSLSPSSSSTRTLDSSSPTFSFLSGRSRSPSLFALPCPTSGYGCYPSHHHTSLTSGSTPARTNTSDVVYTGTGGHSAVSPAGSYGSYRGTNTTSSLDEGSGSGRASGVSSGMMGSQSSRVSEMLSETSRVMGVTESRGNGAQRYTVEDESRGDEGTSGRGEGTDEHGHGRGQGAGHAHSTSLSTVTGSPPRPRGGSSGVAIRGVFSGSGFSSGSSYQAQPGYSVQPSHPPYGFTQQHAQPQAQALAHMRASQEQYQYEAVSASHATPPSGFTNLHGRSEFQVQSQPVAEPQGQARTTVPATRAPPVRTSTKRPRAPKRPRPHTSAGPGIGPSRGNLPESDDDSDDDEITEWVPGLDDSGGPSGSLGFGFSGSAGTGELGGSGGGTVQAAPALPGGRKCVSLLFRCPLSPLW